jgi:beta-galactosidase/beta-glucuronidase
MGTPFGVFSPCRVCLTALMLISAVFSLQADPAPPIEPDPRVSPVNRPLPVGGLPILPMTGTWRFSLSHGVMLKNAYEDNAIAEEDFSSSSNQPGSIGMYAFDTGDGSTDGKNWCASGPQTPQWVQADLGAIESVSGIELHWEKKDGLYQCKVEGSTDNSTWNLLIDKTAAPGINDGLLTWTPTDARYIKITITKATAKPYAWADMHGCRIHILKNGTDTVWKSAGPTPEQIAEENKFADPLSSDSDWKDMSVPSNWEMLGYSQPQYGSVDNTVGLYRRTVDVPAGFAGHRVFWRFDGVFESAEIFVNGKRVGYHESGFTAFDVDLTDFIVPGRPNLFAVRVCKAVFTSDMETGDFEALGGIYRNNFLYAVPATHISDITIRTTLDPQYVNATLAADLEVTGQPGQNVNLTGTLLDAAGQQVPTGRPINASITVGQDGKGSTTLSVPVDHPFLWSAEKPNLYTLAVSLSGPAAETIRQPFGFRQIEISPDQVVLWNGVPIKCAGTCRHEIYPSLGSALTDEIWMKDITLMKGANINAVRTSHYNHASRFLDLCDQNGFYLLDEIPFCWIQDRVSDPSFVPGMLQRSLETYERDKNRPSVLAWSCGNENPVGSDEQAVLDFMHQHDPTRPAFASCLNHNDLKGQSFTDFHYPWPPMLEQLAKNDGKHAPVILTEQPHIFWQGFWHQYDPGVSDLWGEVISKSWNAVDNYPDLVGSFIWEWQDQPIADLFNDDGKDKKTGLRFQNNKGVVTGYREPKPEYWEVKMAYSQVKIDPAPLQPTGGTCPVAITNRYSFTNLDELKCRWQAFDGSQLIGQGEQKVECAPLQSITVSFPAPIGMTSLQITFSKPAGDLITGAVLKVAGAPDPQPPVYAGPSGGNLAVKPGDAPTISNGDMEVDFDAQTGQMSHWTFRHQDLVSGVSQFNLGQAVPNDDDHLKEFIKPGQTLSLDNAKWTTTDNSDNSIDAVSTADVSLSKLNGKVGTLTTTYTVRPDAQIAVHWEFHWTGAKMKTWEIGEKLQLPATLSNLAWLRDSVFSYYPPDHLGAPSGHCGTDDLRFRASKRGLHWLTLTDSSGVGLALQSIDTPLLGRADTMPGGTALFASLKEAGPQDFSGSWVDGETVILDPAKPISGDYLLRPVMAAQ